MREVNLESPKVRERLERDTKVKHFTMGFRSDNGYGETWGTVVQAYLKDGYKTEGDVKEITVSGILYKILVRSEDTVFYDADGATLFDVENGRLESEYGKMTQRQGKTGTDCPIKTQIEESGEKELKCSGGIDEECRQCEKAADPVGESGVEGRDAMDIKEQAKKKLEQELERAEDRAFADPIIGHLLKRCMEDGRLAHDVMQEHKTWEKCVSYIDGQAEAHMPKKRAAVVRVAIRYEVVYEWAEDYYHKDDKAEEEEKARKEAERKAEQAKAAAERKAKAKEKPVKASVPEKKEDKPKGQLKPKKNSRDMDGQLDMFSMMGM